MVVSGMWKASLQYTLDVPAPVTAGVSAGVGGDAQIAQIALPPMLGVGFGVSKPEIDHALRQHPKGLRRLGHAEAVRGRRHSTMRRRSRSSFLATPRSVRSGSRSSNRN